MLHKQVLIAIDGQTASGKSTAARNIAKRLNFIHIDTGAMYRAFAWYAAIKKVDPLSRPEVAALIKTAGFKVWVENNVMKMEINGEDPIPHLREDMVSDYASKVATVPEIREYLVNQQREIRNVGSIVMEGRDIGTVVAPDTVFKFFFEADPAVRKQRREDEGRQDCPTARDQRDSKSGGLLPRAADSVLIDTTHTVPEQVMELMLDELAKKGLKVEVTA
jgi:cytidylate kinase